MKYIINNKSVFNANDLTLFIGDHPEITTKLKKPVARLLLELLHSSNVNVSREDLLVKVWTKNGFTASNAGLNNYISELRKAFSLVGCDYDIIITVPKFGFRFEAEVISRDVSGEFSVNSLSEEEPVSGGDDNKKATIKKPSIFSLPVKISVLILSLTIILFSAWVMLKKEASHPLEEIASIEKCDIYSMSKLYDNDETVADVTNILKREGVDCSSHPLDVFYMEDRINRKTVRADLVSVCNRNDNHQYDICFNIKSQRDTSK